MVRAHGDPTMERRSHAAPRAGWRRIVVQATDRDEHWLRTRRYRTHDHTRSKLFVPLGHGDSHMASESPQQQSQMGLATEHTTNLNADELAAVEKLQKAYHDMKAELGKVI